MPPGEWHPKIKLGIYLPPSTQLIILFSLFLDPPVQVLKKEERLELKAEATKNNNGHCANGKKNGEHDGEGHGDDPALQFTGR